MGVESDFHCSGGSCQFVKIGQFDGLWNHHKRKVPTGHRRWYVHMSHRMDRRWWRIHLWYKLFHPKVSNALNLCK
jgi:hypothetical protein